VGGASLRRELRAEEGDAVNDAVGKLGDVVREEKVKGRRGVAEAQNADDNAGAEAGASIENAERRPLAVSMLGGVTAEGANEEAGGRAGEGGVGKANGRL
jgi:hypothetical protein